MGKLVVLPTFAYEISLFLIRFQCMQSEPHHTVHGVPHQHTVFKETKILIYVRAYVLVRFKLFFVSFHFAVFLLLLLAIDYVHPKVKSLSHSTKQPTTTNKQHAN